MEPGPEAGDRVSGGVSFPAQPWGRSKRARDQDVQTNGENESGWTETETTEAQRGGAKPARERERYWGQSDREMVTWKPRSRDLQREIDIDRKRNRNKTVMKKQRA